MIIADIVNKQSVKNIVRPAQVCQKIGRSLSWLGVAVKSGNFPTPMKVHGNGIGWEEQDIDDWIDNRNKQIRKKNKQLQREKNKRKEWNKRLQLQLQEKSLHEIPKETLKLCQVCEKISMSRSWVYRAMKLDDFPTPLKIGVSSVWVEREVDDWISSRPTTNIEEPIRELEEPTVNIEENRFKKSRLSIKDVLESVKEAFKKLLKLI